MRGGSRRKKKEGRGNKTREHNYLNATNLFYENYEGSKRVQKRITSIN